MEAVKKSSAALILAAWLVVTVPAGWGVYKTVMNAAKLFQPAPPVAAAPAAVPAATPTTAAH